MKKSLILTFVFAWISCASVFAQNDTRPGAAEKPKLEQPTHKANPSDARPGAETPKTRPAPKKEVEKGEKGEKSEKAKKGEKGEKGKKKGHKKGKGHTKDHNGKAKGHHKGHHHESEGEVPQGRTKDKTRNTDKNGKVPEEAPKGRKPLPQGEKN
ncbi:MAG: hypothetical protein ACKVU0_17295 [Saprospiraceae bacterium]